MKTGTHIIAVIALAAASTFAAEKEKKDDDVFGGFEDTGRIVINAASAKKVVPPMRWGKDAKAAKGKFLEIPDSGKGGAKVKEGQGHAVFEFEAKEEAKYYLHVRVWWTDGCGNSINVAVDGKKNVRIEDPTYKHWHWVKAKRKVIKLGKGKHTLKVSNREDGARFDQILLTNDKEYVPQGIEE